MVVLGSLLGAVGFNLSRSAPQEDMERERGALKRVILEADSFSEKKGQPPHYEAYRAENGEKQLIGFCFTTTDVAPEERGYAGPIRIMVGMDLEGTITGIEILHHTETPSYVRELRAPWFIGQFRGKRIGDAFRVGEDVDGITRATVTSEAVARAVRKSARKAARRWLGLQVEEEGRGSSKVGVYLLGALLTVSVVGFLRGDRRLRVLSLGGGLLFLGFLKSSPVSMVNLASILSLKLPLFSYNVFWYLLVGFAILSAFLLGRVYCGWVCPFGAAVELLNRVRLRKLRISERVDRKAKYIKYFILWALLIASLLLNNVNVSHYEPFSPLFNRSGGLLMGVFLIVVLGSELFVPRFWCRYLCAVGASLGLISRVSLWRVRAREACGSCIRCVALCPMGAREKGSDGWLRVDPSECIGCDERIRDCPQRILIVGTRGRSGTVQKS